MGRDPGDAWAIRGSARSRARQAGGVSELVPKAAELVATFVETAEHETPTGQVVAIRRLVDQ
jgi:hypothetical protein